jgi:hypothetical protein
VAISLVVASIALAGCSGSDQTSSDTSPVPTPKATVVTPATNLATKPSTNPPAATAPPGSPSPAETARSTTPVPPPVATSPVSSGAPTTARTSADGTLSQADLDAITGAFSVFFGGATSTVDEKVTVLQDGEMYRQMLTDASANEQFQQMSTDIRAIAAGSAAACTASGVEPGCALVEHDVLVAGFPMAAGIESPATRIDGIWVVGARAWCNLVEIGGESCPAPGETTP